MRKKLLNILKNNQRVVHFKQQNLIKLFFKNKQFSTYALPSLVLKSRNTTKLNTFCLIQGKLKKTLKVYKFNRHLVRANTIKNSFQSLRSKTW